MVKTLTGSQDAQGRLMYDFFKGKDVFEVIKRDDGFIQANPVSTYFREYRQWSRIEKDAISYVRGRVLDVGCGPGGIHCIFRGRGSTFSASMFLHSP